MFSIGKFSRLTGLSTKTLIWYDSIGLLKPNKVDFENGYRYYDDENFKDVINIKYFQSMGFTIKEIMELSSEVLNKKIEQLEKQINLLIWNIEFLNKLNEKNMKKKDYSLFYAGEDLLKGKWEYKKSTTDFNEVIDFFELGKKSEGLPKYLFFGDNNVGTDGNFVFGYDRNFFSLGEEISKPYFLFMLNKFETLVLYEKPNEKDKVQNVVFNVYERRNSNQYSSKDITAIYEKNRKEIGDKNYLFNTNLVGNWKLVDEIYESQIEKYDVKIKEKDACYSLSPLFDILDIQENKEVFIMEQGKELELNSFEKAKHFTRENSRISICMDKCKQNGIKLKNTLINVVHKGLYKKKDGQEYLFVNLDNDLDLDESVYVYKKEY